MASILDDLRYTWNKPNSVLPKLILINVSVFVILNILRVLFLSHYKEIAEYFAMPTSIAGRYLVLDDIDYSSTPFIHRPWTLITSFFTHVGFWHIVSNMLYLYWFGMIIREFLGDRKLLALYFLGGLLGSISVLVLFNTVPSLAERAGGLAMGASAAVFAIMTAAATKFPEYRFHLLFIGPVKIRYIVLVAIFLSFVGLRDTNVGGQVAHLAGALIGFLYIKQYDKGRDLGRPILYVIDAVSNLFKSKSKIKVTHRSGSRRATGRKSASKATSSSSVSAAKSEQAEIDAILDKISQSGYESLTREEKQKLFNASKR